jgi:hypothetical protein
MHVQQAAKPAIHPAPNTQSAGINSAKISVTGKPKLAA